MKNWHFYLLLIFTIIYTASLVPVFKLTLQYATVEQISIFDYAFSAILFFMIILVQNKLPLLKQNLLRTHDFIFLGCIGLAVNRLLYLSSFHLIPATEANILYYTYPLLIGILGFFVLKEKMRITNLIGLILGFFGAFIVITKLTFTPTAASLLGDLLAIGGGFGYAIYLVFSKKWKIDVFVLQFYASFFATISLIVYALIFSNLTLPPSNSLSGIVYLSIADAVLIIMFIELLRAKNTFKIANFFYAIPFVVAVLNHLILGEVIYLSYLFGLVLLVIGILIQHKGKEEHQS